MKITKRALTLTLALAMLLTALLSGCGSSGTSASAAPSAAAAQKKDTLTVAMAAAPASLFPNVTDVYSYEVMTNIYDTLLFMDSDLSLKPMLAKSYEFKSPTELQFTLRNDITFHNGDKMTADDVVYTFTYYLNEPKVASARPANLTKVEKIDDYTVKFTFSQANNFVINTFASQRMPILDKKTQGNEANSAFTPNGTGPYKFVKKDNDIINLERNDNYWGDKAKIKTLVFKPITDDQARLIAAQNGEVDVAERMSATSFASAQKDGKLTCTAANANTIYGMVINAGDPALQDVRVRQAISYAIDINAINAIATDGKAKASETIIPASLDKDIGVKMHTYDPAKAKQLLADAKVSNLKLTAIVYQIDYAKGMTVIQDQLKQVGITLDIQTYELATWSSMVAKRSYQLSIIAFNSADSSLDGILYGKFNNKTGSFGYTNADVTAALDKARALTDKTQQIALYKQAVQQIANDAIVVPWFEITLNYIYSKSLQGVVINNYGAGGLNRYNTASWQ